MTATPRLWLHVGPAKTGTTSIQATLRRNEDLLADHGVLYPRIADARWGGAGNNHAVLARALHGDDTDFIGRAIAGLPTSADTVLSAEGFPRSGAERLAWLADLLGRRYDLTAIYYMRDPVSRAVSSAGQAIKRGKSTYGEILATPKPTVRFRRQIEMLTAAFGAERLMVREFSPRAFHRGDLVSDFCAAIGRPGLLGADDTDRRDGAITMEDVVHLEVARRAEIGDPDTAVPPDLRTSSTKFFLPDAYLAKVRENTAPDLQWLFETYGIDFR